MVKCTPTYKVSVTLPGKRKKVSSKYTLFTKNENVAVDKKKTDPVHAVPAVDMVDGNHLTASSSSKLFALTTA